MLKLTCIRGKTTNGSILIPLVTFLFVTALAVPAKAQAIREYWPIEDGEMYEQIFLDDFYNALGYRPQGYSWEIESEVARLLITGGVHGERNNYNDALNTFAQLPVEIASTFPFLTTMREDLLVPEILQPWYDGDDARMMMFAFYEEVWLPNPQYRNDYNAFHEDTMGRESRTDPTVPAVWIRGHLADYGYVPDSTAGEHGHYLFLWDLMSSMGVYVQRATFYGVPWDRYSPDDYKQAVVRHVGEMIHAAHDAAAHNELGRGFWSDLIDTYHPFEAPTEGVESPGEISPPERTGPVSLTGNTGSAVFTAPESGESNQQGTEPVEENVPEESGEIEALVHALTNRVESEIENNGQVETPVDETVTEPVQAEDESPSVEEVTGPEVGEVPDEFRTEGPTERTPSEIAPENLPPSELGNYAIVRLGEISDQLVVEISGLAHDLGMETIDLVVLYNDINVSEETLANAEMRYIAKREAFLAGLGVWDRFDLEIYTPLILADFNDIVISSMESPYEELKANATLWSQYESYEAHFLEAFGQIESGVRNRRDETDVLTAEAEALTAFLGDYNELIKEIEDLLSGAVTEPPAEE